MDRTTINNVADDRAWAFTPDNVVDRSPAFRLAFPFDTKAEPTLIYKNEIATTYMAQPAGEGEAAGLHVINFTGEQATPVPASPAYIAAISTFNPLPGELTLDQLKPVLKAKGLDVDALLPQLLPNLTPDDTNTLLGLAAAPIKLQYLFTFSGADSVEPSTGSIVEVHDVLETLYVAPDPTVLPKLREVLARYPNVPAAVAGRRPRSTSWPPSRSSSSRTRSRRPTRPWPTWSKTVKDAKKLKDLATTTVPNALRYGGIGLTVLGLLLALVPKRSSRRGKGGAPGPDEQPVEVHLAPGEQIVITEPSPADVRAGGRRTGDSRRPWPSRPGRHRHRRAHRADGRRALAARAAPGYANVPPYSSRSAAFWTLAIALRGSSSTTNTRLGLLEPGQLSVEPGEDRSDRRRAPSARGTTAATTASPKSGWGTPKTADSATPGRASMTVLDLLRVDVEAAGDDQVLGPADDVHVAVVVDLDRGRR